MVLAIILDFITFAAFLIFLVRERRNFSLIAQIPLILFLFVEIICGICAICERLFYADCAGIPFLLRNKICVSVGFSEEVKPKGLNTFQHNLMLLSSGLSRTKDKILKKSPRPLVPSSSRPLIPFITNSFHRFICFFV